MTDLEPRAFEPEIAIPPASTVREMMQVKGIDAAELARQLGWSPTQLDELFHAQEVITVATAEQLERIFDLPRSFWLNLERNYRWDLARLERAAMKEHVKAAV